MRSWPIPSSPLAWRSPSRPRCSLVSPPPPNGRCSADRRQRRAISSGCLRSEAFCCSQRRRSSFRSGRSRFQAALDVDGHCAGAGVDASFAVAIRSARLGDRRRVAPVGLAAATPRARGRPLDALGRAPRLRSGRAGGVRRRLRRRRDWRADLFHRTVTGECGGLLGGQPSWRTRNGWPCSPSVPAACASVVPCVCFEAASTPSRWRSAPGIPRSRFLASRIPGRTTDDVPSSSTSWPMSPATIA